MNRARATGKVFVANLSISVISFIGIAFFAREIGSTQIGVFFLFQAVVNVLALVTDLGIEGAVTKRISEGMTPDDVFASSLLLKAVPVAVVTAGIVLLRDQLNGYIGGEVAVLLIVTLVMHQFAMLTVRVLQGELRVGETAIVRLSRQFVWVVAGIVLVVRGFEAIGLIYALIAGYVVMSAWGLLRIDTGVGRPRMEHARSLLDFSKYNFISDVGWKAFSWVDVLIIGFLLTKADVGGYEIAWRVSGMAMMLTHALATTTFPTISALAAEGAIEEIEDYLQDAVIVSLLLVIPSMFGILLFSREILGLLFGLEYTFAWVALDVLIVFKLIQALNQVVAPSLNALDQPELTARAMGVGVVLNVVLNVILITTVGLVGAAIATTVSYIVITLLITLYLSRFVDFRVPYRGIGWCGVAGLGMAAVLWTVESLVVMTLPVLIALIVLGAIVYGGLVLFNASLRERTLQTIGQVMTTSY